MKQNVGSLDRIIRLAIGSAFVVLGIAGYIGFVSLAWIGIGQALASVVVVLLGLILLVTGATRTCLIYAALGISTADRPVEPQPSEGKPA